MNGHKTESSNKMQDIDLNDNKLEFGNTMRAANYMFDLFYDNKFQEAYSMADQYSSVSMIYAHTKAFFSFLYAILTQKKTDLLRGIRDVEESLRFAKKVRKPKSIVGNATSLFWKANASKYSDEELHAELIYGECSVMLGYLTFFYEQSIMSLLKCALRVITANRCLKFCNESLSDGKQWDSEEAKMQFESGVLFGFGVFNLAISMTPKKIIQILSFVGFPGNREVAMKCLRKCTELTSGVRCRIAVFAVLGFAIGFEQVVGIQEFDAEWIRSLLEYWGQKFPKSVFLVACLSKYHSMRGDPKMAIDGYNECRSIQNELKIIHTACQWEAVWCFMSLCEWENAINEAQLPTYVTKSSFYSRATTQYQIAVCKMMQMEDSKNEDLRHEVDQLMILVPKLKRRFVGQTIPHEKFICNRAVQYFDENRKDGLVALMEFFYIWNYLCMLKTNQLADPFLRRINEKLKLFEGNKDKRQQIAVLNLVKGVILRNVDKDEEAVKCFQDIIESKKAIKKDTFVVPNAIFELGITYLKMCKVDESRRYLEKVKCDDFDRYLEAIVNLRVASALRQLDHIDQNNNLIVRSL